MANFLPEALISRDRRPGALGELRILPDELICSILEYLDPRDVARCACVSSVMYILCNEEPLWMSLCFKRVNGPLQYKGSWKKTALHLENQEDEYEKPPRLPLYFDGFNSSFMYRRFYRCHTALDGFYMDHGDIERRANLSLEDFHNTYDGKKPVLLTGLVETWPAKSTWSVDHFSLKHGDKAFRISQRSSRKISMKFEDYVSYMKLQQDEDPLYIFDDKFGEIAPDLLKDYNVPHLFQEDYFDVLDRDQRPPFRWLIVGPQRSGASWHVDPALTSAWNTLLCGRKRWALYPPGRVPLGVTVHINGEDGDVDIETPSSLQWWLDFYPLLADEDKPIECTQLPGETIYVPSGWWHCVLNLDTTIAVTQNFVNSNNLEFVCLDMAPGHRHKGVCRAGFLALDEQSLENAENYVVSGSDGLSDLDLTRKEKRMKTLEAKDIQNHERESNGLSKHHRLWKQGISYDIAFLSTFLDEERDHYNSPWSSGNCIGQRELRQWLSKLWIQKPEMRELVWKGACLALNAGKWLECVGEICAFYNLSPPSEDERLPVGTGSNPVYLMDDRVIKIFVEGGLEASVYSLGTELEFYSLLHKVNSLLKDHIPDILASGIVYIDNGIYKVIPWDGKDVPDGIPKGHLTFDISKGDAYPLGIWSKKKFEYKKAGVTINEWNSSTYTAKIWPFIITKRCSGKIFAQLREMLSREDILNLASFLGEQLRCLHLLPHQDLVDPTFANVNHNILLSSSESSLEAISDGANTSTRWDIFVGILRRKRKDVINRLKKWGDFIPNTLLQKVEDYIPDDLGTLLDVFEAESGLAKIWDGYSWIHSDIMDDNIQMEPCLIECCPDSNIEGNDSTNGYDGGGKRKSWRPSYILDFSDLSIGDPLCDLIPIHLDIFRGDTTLLKQFLESYKLPLVRRSPEAQHDPAANKFQRLSYRAMCYCILHDENIMGAILSLWEELKTADSWEEIELTVWGELNNYKGFARD